MLSLIRRIRRKTLCENVNRTSYAKNCLVVYITPPISRPRLPVDHQNVSHVRMLVNVIGEFGYNVDVADMLADTIRLHKQYDLVIDVHPGMHPEISPACIGAKRVAFITGSNPAFSNAAEEQRLRELYERRGVMLKQRRWAKPFVADDIETLDAFWFIGNKYNLKSYDSFRLPPVFYLRNSAQPQFYDISLTHRDSKAFMYLAGGGSVHKGLDRVLEAFSARPDLKLYVCSPFRYEQDFCEVYKHELFRTPNIIPIGFLKLGSKRFKRLAEICAFSIQPSCSEGMSGSVLTVMSAGMIPLISRECGFADGEVIILPDCSVETIKEQIEKYASHHQSWINKRAQHSRDVARTLYSEDRFRDAVRLGLQALERPLDGKNDQPFPGAPGSSL